jgi:hypothetical protein
LGGLENVAASDSNFNNCSCRAISFAYKAWKVAETVHDSNDTIHLFDDQRLLENFIFNHTIDRVTPDYDKLCPNFLYKLDEAIKHTFNRSTQMAGIPMSTHLRTWYRAPNPAMNIPRQNEDLLIDYVYSDVSAINDGSTGGAQVFFGRATHVGDVYGMKSEAHFSNALQENI